MKKIGLMYGMEQTFPPAVVDYINNMPLSGISAEFMKIGAEQMNESLDYTVIFDRVSNEVPFYRSVLKNAALNGVRVVNNPFWSSADDNFFHASLATKIGIGVPKTVILPSKHHPAGTGAESMRNMQYPLNWDAAFEYVGFPAYLKSNKGNGFYNAYKVYNPQEFFSAYDLTGDQVMILQQSIEFDKYFRCYVIGQKNVRIMNYDPGKPQHLRYDPSPVVLDPKSERLIEKTCIKINKALGFEFNAVEFALLDDKIYAVDFMNPLPNAEKAFLHNENFNWLVENVALYLVELAREGKVRSKEYNWSAFLRGPKSAPKKRRTSKVKK